jgi:hypothetical protein
MATPLRRFHLPAADGSLCPKCGRLIRASSLTVSQGAAATGWIHVEQRDDCSADVALGRSLPLRK